MIRVTCRFVYREEFVVKKVVSGIASLVVLSLSFGAVQSKNIFSVNSSEVLSKSKEGRALVRRNELAKKKLMDFEFEQSKKIAAMRDEMDKMVRGGNVDEELLQKKHEAMLRAQRNAQHEINCRREDRKLEEQKLFMSFRKKVNRAAEKFFAGKDCDMAFDRSTPGIMYVATKGDMTKEFIEKLDADFAKEKATMMLTKASGNKKGNKTA